MSIPCHREHASKCPVYNDCINHIYPGIVNHIPKLIFYNSLQKSQRNPLWFLKQYFNIHLRVHVIYGISNTYRIKMLMLALNLWWFNVIVVESQQIEECHVIIRVTQTQTDVGTSVVLGAPGTLGFWPYLESKALLYQGQYEMQLNNYFAALHKITPVWKRVAWYQQKWYMYAGRLEQ